MLENQHDQDPVIQDFLIWQNSQETWRTGTGGWKDEANTQYIPLAALQARFSTPNQTSDLLKSLFRDDDPPDANYVGSHYLRPFAILLSIGKGYMISSFVKHESLQDQALPLRSKPLKFPECSDCNLWELFNERQWKYCAVKLRYKMSSWLDQEDILPFCITRKLGQGGSAEIYEINVDEGYNELSPPAGGKTVNEKPTTNTFVLKKYRGREAAEYYETETGAFKKLNSQAGQPPSIIGFHGSFVRNATYNVILEYADRGTLRDFMQQNPPPSEARDMIDFWKQLLKLPLGLHTIHNAGGTDTKSQMMLGWHQDVKPANILVKSRKEASAYNCDFVLGDLGTSHFKKVERARSDTADSDSRGTYSYGAPETFRVDHVFNSLPLNVKQNVDVWSLGCVYSEVATWIAHGWPRVEEYQLRRKEEVTQTLTEQDGDLFHNGRNVLKAVENAHRSTKACLRRNDYITRQILDHLVPDMLEKAESRLNAMQIYGKAQRIVSIAEEIFESTLSDTINVHRAITPSDETFSKVHLERPFSVNRALGSSSSRSLSQSNLSPAFEHHLGPSPPDPDDAELSANAAKCAAVDQDQSKGKQKEEQAPEHPTLSVEAVLKLRKTKQWDRAEKLSHDSLLNSVENRDHVFMIDNTESMKEHRKLVRDTLEAMGYLVKRYDPDGIDLHFTQSPRVVKRITRTSILLADFDKEAFVGISDMQEQLSRYLEDYGRKFDDKKRWSPRSAWATKSLSHARKGPPRRLSLYIFTDGIWQPRNEVVPTITAMVKYLKDNDLIHKQIGIQFIQFGSNERATERLGHLDHGLNLELDIVDTTPAKGGNVWKMLLGAVNNWFDDDKPNPPPTTPNTINPH